MRPDEGLVRQALAAPSGDTLAFAESVRQTQCRDTQQADSQQPEHDVELRGRRQRAGIDAGLDVAQELLP